MTKLFDRRWWVGGACLLALLVVNADIVRKEMILASDNRVLLKLAPLDPRSLMQGDYMALRFQLAVDARGAPDYDQQSDDGYLIVSVDKNRVGHFVRFDNGVALTGAEQRIRYRIRKGRMKIATNAFFFQEGKAKHFEQAEYGEFAVDTSGNPLLVAMADEQLKSLGVMKR
jgi:uncharacterized membrane-anchored protein